MHCLVGLFIGRTTYNWVKSSPYSIEKEEYSLCLFSVTKNWTL